MKREFAIRTHQRPVRFAAGKWEYETIIFRVRVMARAEGYAMVRRRGAMPFAVSEKELSADTGESDDDIG